MRAVQFTNRLGLERPAFEETVKLYVWRADADHLRTNSAQTVLPPWGPGRDPHWCATCSTIMSPRPPMTSSIGVRTSAGAALLSETSTMMDLSVRRRQISNRERACRIAFVDNSLTTRMASTTSSSEKSHP